MRCKSANFASWSDGAARDQGGPGQCIHHVSSPSEGSAPKSIGRFTPAERDAYLSSRGVVKGIPKQVLEVASHPRIAFHLVHFIREPGAPADVTREQLLLRDFIKRPMRGGGTLDEEGFVALVTAQARAVHQALLSRRACSVGSANLARGVDLAGRDRAGLHAVLHSLAGSTWWERGQVDLTRFCFSDAAIPDAVGFALAGRIRALRVEEAIVEINCFLEPWCPDDLVENILRSCATVLVADPDVGDALCMALLERWQGMPFHSSASRDFWRRLHVFRPDLFLDLCFWRGQFGGSWLLEWGIACLWEDHPCARPRIERQISAKLSISSSRSDRDNDGASRLNIADCDCMAPRRRTTFDMRAAGSRDFARRVATRILSFLPCLGFVPILASWAQTHAIESGDESLREIGSLLRYNYLDYDETLAAVRAQVDALESRDTEYDRKAAILLLYATGEPDDAVRADMLGTMPPRSCPASFVRGVGDDGSRVSFAPGGDGPIGRSMLAALADYAFDPDVELEPAVAAALDIATANLTTVDVPALFESGAAALLTLLRWHPGKFRALLPDILPEDCSEGAAGAVDGKALLQQFWPGAISFLEEDEGGRVTGHFIAPGSSAEPHRATVLRLVCRPLVDQIAWLMASPADDWPRGFDAVLNAPLGSEIADLVAGIDLARPKEEIWPALVLADTLTARFESPVPVVADWRAGFENSDQNVRSRVASIADKTDPGIAVQQLLAATATGMPADGETLPFYASAILLALDDDQLRPWLPRLNPEVMMRVYHRRPGLRAEVRDPLLGWMEDKLLVPRIGRGFSDGYASYADRDDAYAAFCREDHDEAVRLIETAWNDARLRDNIGFERGEGPARGLIKGLAVTETELVRNIWRDIGDDTRGIWIEDIEIFPSTLPVGEGFDDLRAEMLVRAKTDHKLLGAVVALERNGHGAFLRSWVRAGLNVGPALDRARTLTVAGFLDATDEAIALWCEIDATPAPAGWLGEIRATARAWFDHLRATRHWHREMCAASDAFDACRAFWLAGRHFDDWHAFCHEAAGVDFASTGWHGQRAGFCSGERAGRRAGTSGELRSSFVLGDRVDDLIYDA